MQRYRSAGLQLIALTRLADPGADRAVEKGRIDSGWKSVYAEAGPAAIVISEASMVRYGGASTPTFVFIDRRGVVRRYTPTRLTEEELDGSLRRLMD
jgi:hypothetical protein